LFWSSPAQQYYDGFIAVLFDFHFSLCFRKISAKEKIYAQLLYTDIPVLQELKKNISAKSAVAMMSSFLWSAN